VAFAVPAEPALAPKLAWELVSSKDPKGPSDNKRRPCRRCAKTDKIPVDSL